MRLIEIFGHSVTMLYHGTTFEKAENILKKNKLFGTLNGAGKNADANRRVSKKYSGAASLSRNIRVSATFGGDVIFLINKELLSRDLGKRVTPVADLDYNGGKSENPLATEYEELVWGGIDNFSKYLENIYILTDTTDWQEFNFNVDAFPLVFNNDKSVIAFHVSNPDNRTMSSVPKPIMSSEKYISLLGKSSVKQVSDKNKEPEEKDILRGVLNNSGDNSEILSAIKYAKRYKGGRWPALEQLIVDKPQEALIYTLYLLKKRWPAAEPAILTHPYASVTYARKIIKGRWPEYEKEVISDPNSDLAWSADIYARDIIGGPWPEAGIKQ